MTDPLTLAAFRGLLAGGRESWANARTTIVLLGSGREELLAEIDDTLAEVARLGALLDRIHKALHEFPSAGMPAIQAILAEAVECDACQEAREEADVGSR